MTRFSKAVFTTASALLIGLASSHLTHADWSEDFNGSTLQQPWFFGSQLPSGAPSSTFQPNDQLNNYPDAIVNNQLQMFDPNAVSAGGAANAFGVNVSEPFTDVRYTGILNPNGSASSSDTLALIARGDIGSGKFYAAELSFEDNRLILFRNNDLTGSANDLAFVEIPGLDNSQSVYLDFRVIGQTISVDAFDAPGGNPLGSLSVVDNDPVLKITNPGVSGTLVFFAGDLDKPLLGQFDDLSSMRIPEPTSLMLALVALSAGLVGGRSRRA